MSDSTEARRTQKREWARKQAKVRKERGAVSYTSEWRHSNPEGYEEQKRLQRERRAQAKLTKTTT